MRKDLRNDRRKLEDDDVSRREELNQELEEIKENFQKELDEERNNLKKQQLDLVKKYVFNFVSFCSK